MFDYESLQGLGGFRDVRLEPLPVSEENVFRTAYSGTHPGHGNHSNGTYIEGVVLLVANKETRELRQIHLFKHARL
jgi:hypothetical protein